MTLSLQMYSMRDCADQIALLADLPAMGVTQLEGYGGLYEDPTAYRAAMDAQGLTMPSGHMGIFDIEADFDGAVATAKTLGMTRIYAPHLAADDRPTDTAGYTAFAKRLNALALQFADHGITFGWHNHDFEFVALSDGGIPMDIMLDAAPDMAWEGDLAWIVRGGRDPMDYVNRYGARLSAIHVKDIAPAGENLDEDGWSDLGAGTIDWTALLRACRSHSDDIFYVLEHDKPSDPIGYAARSAKAFKTLWGESA